MNEVKNTLNKSIVSHGLWTSPITAEQIANGEISTINMLIDEDRTYFCELRPNNQGRYTIVCRHPSGRLEDVTPPDFNVRSFVHEYGGGAFTVSRGVIYASNATNHAIYIIKEKEKPFRLTEGQKKTAINGVNKWQGTRFADMHSCKYGLVAIGEYHEPEKPVENFLALIDIKSGQYKKLASGYDFYSSPSISLDEKKIAWISWNHPNMPWTNSELWVAEFDEDGTLKNQKRIAGEKPESIFQPQWSPEGTLYFVTDRDRGWWNIHRYFNEKVENVCPIEAEVAEPLWVFQRSTYAFLGSNIIFTYNSQGIWKLGLLDIQAKRWEKIPTSGTFIQQLRNGKGFVQLLEGYPQKPPSLLQIDQESPYICKPIRTLDMQIHEGYISVPQHIAFPSNGRVGYGFYYPPRNQDYQSPLNEKPPLIVMIHGGPTSQAKSFFQLKMQYWTTRGFAILDVNYGGSSGYGRGYRQLLDKNWGVVDIEDCVNGALFLVKQGVVDANKLVIRGGSAGGYTTLAALAFKETFKAGASYYGVADITALAHDTHKFEKEYMQELVGKYPEEKKVWEERSPINSVDKIKSPLILFQGENDMIVPKNQSIMIFEALKKRGLEVELYIYPEEEHGFRQAAHIAHSLNREAEFYLETFKLKQKTSSEPVQNLFKRV